MFRQTGVFKSFAKLKKKTPVLEFLKSLKQKVRFLWIFEIIKVKIQYKTGWYFLFNLGWHSIQLYIVP